MRRHLTTVLVVLAVEAHPKTKIYRLIADYKKKNKMKRGQSDLCSEDTRKNKRSRLRVDELHARTTEVM